MSPVYHDGNGKWWYCRDNALDAGPFATEREAWEAYDAYCVSQQAAKERFDG